jgi:molybdate/tungstate transport system substrate-binding protein
MKRMKACNRRPTARTALGAGVAAVGVLATVCGSSASATTLTGNIVAAKASGDVDVLSAGSLDTVVTKVIAPAFHKATGYTLVDTSGGSSTLAADIKNKVDRADVFLSASPSVNTTLEGKANGDWVSWYAAFASSPLVLGYYPKSKFASDLKAGPWYKVITMPGFKLGRTNPTQDPGGVLAAEALNKTAKAKHLPALAKLASETSDEYAEDPEEADIVSGQLDAAFMYEADANSQGSPFVRLAGVNLSGDYTITLLRNAPHTAAAEAFVKFLVGSKGRAAFRADHFAIVSPPKVTGTGVPSGLAGVLGS